MGPVLKLADTTPNTLAGLSTFVEYVANYPDLKFEACGTGMFEALGSIAKAFRNLFALDPSSIRQPREMTSSKYRHMTQHGRALVWAPRQLSAMKLLTHGTDRAARMR